METVLPKPGTSWSQDEAPLEDEGCLLGTAQEDAGTAEMPGRSGKGAEGTGPSPPLLSLISRWDLPFTEPN